MRSAGTSFGVWPMSAAPHFFSVSKNCARVSWVLKPGMVSSLSRVPPVWPRLRPLIMGTQMPGTPAGVGVDEACGGEDGGDEEGGLVAYAAGGVLVDGEGMEGRGVEGLAGVAHGGGEGGELVGVEAALEDGHEEAGDLGVGDELVARVCGRRWLG